MMGWPVALCHGASRAEVAGASTAAIEWPAVLLRDTLRRPRTAVFHNVSDLQWPAGGPVSGTISPRRFLTSSRRIWSASSRKFCSACALTLYTRLNSVTSFM
jgi:hypothetical protein